MVLCLHTVSKSFGRACVGWQKVLTLEFVLFVGLAVGMTTCRQGVLVIRAIFYSLLFRSVYPEVVKVRWCSQGRTYYLLSKKRLYLLLHMLTRVISHSLPCIKDNRVVVIVR